VLLKLDLVDPLPLTTVDGNVFYSSGGRSFGRQKVTPVRPQSAGQMHEVAGIVSASRSYAYRMSAAELASWSGATGCGVSDQEVFWWLWSLLFGTSDPASAFLFDGGLIEDLVVAAPVIDADAEELTVEVSSASASSTAVVVVSVSRPQPPGRMPSRSSLRYVANIPVGSPTNVWPEVVAAFGVAPVTGAALRVSVRVADPVTFAGSCPVDVFVQESAGGTLVVTIPVTTHEPFGRWSGTWRADFADYGDTEDVSLSIESLGFGLVSGETGVNRETVDFEMDDFDGTERTETVEFKAEVSDLVPVEAFDSVELFVVA